MNFLNKKGGKINKQNKIEKIYKKNQNKRSK